jgi:small subunit ribosomal protein S6
MSTTAKRNYRATLILDNRGKEDSVDQIVDVVKKDIVAVEGEVGAVENLGRKDFIRVTDKKFPGAPYVQISFTAPASAPAKLKERLRLNQSVYRIFLQTA